MNDLLQTAVNAHGGLARWNQLKSVKVATAITGAKRRIYAYEGDYQPVMEPLPVKIDMGEIRVQ